MTSGFEVNVPNLRFVAESAIRLGDYARNAPIAADFGEAIAESLPGTLSADVAAALEDLWKRRVWLWSGSVSALGQTLRHICETYEQVDEKVTISLRSAAEEFFRQGYGR